MNINSNIFIFFDFQNQPVDVQLVYNEIQKHGRIVGGKAYGSWTKHRMASFVLYNYGIELIEIPEAEFLPNKKGNDIRLAVDCIETAIHNDIINTFFLVTGDADFTALVYKLKSYGKKVIALARTKSASYELVSAVDLFIPYEDIVKNEKLIDPIDRLAQEVEIFLKRSGKEFTIENLLKFLSSFNINPGKYSVNTLHELGQIIYERKVQKPERLKNIKSCILKSIIFENLNESTLPDFIKSNNFELSDVKTAIDSLLSDNVIKIRDGIYEVNRTKAFFSTILEKYPIVYPHLIEFVEKTYKAFSSGKVKSLNQLLQSEFKIPTSEFKSYVEAIKRSGCLKGIDDSDYISYSTPAKVITDLDTLKIAALSYYVKRVLSQTFIFGEEMNYIKELIFHNDEQLFNKCVEYLIENGEITEIAGVYFYTPV
ncbi:MAG: NYN domain-containing protein [Fervidobacterium sp.]